MTARSSSDGESPRGPVPLPRLGFGAAPIGNLYSVVPEGEALAALDEAMCCGIRYFDTAPYYGHGLSERRLGRAIENWAPGSFLLSTKVGRRVLDDRSQSGMLKDGFAVSGTRAVFDYSGEGVLRTFEGSLGRLGVDRVDILFLHDVGRLTHGDRHPEVLHQALAEALPVMAGLRESGAVRAIGLGVNEVDVCLEIMPRFQLDYIMLAGRYTLLEQERAIDMLAEARRRGIGIIVAGPYSSGMLGDPGAPGSTYDYRPAEPATLERAQQLYRICGCAKTDVGALALQFPLAHPAVVSVVAGQRSVAEVLMAAGRRDAVIPQALWHELRAAGIICPAAPIPTS